MAMDSRELDSPLVDLDGLADLRADLRADLHDALHIQAAVGSDRDSPGSLKRHGHGLDLDGDQSTAKKRRKQSKPVRINAPAGAAANAALDGGTVDGAALGDALAEVLGSAGRVSPSLDLEVQVHCQTDGEAREEIPLNLCSLPKTEPSSPVDDLAPFAANKSPGMDVAADLPAPQDRLAMNSFWGMSPPFLYPMMAPQGEQPLGAPLPPPLQPPLGAAMPMAANNHQSRCSPDNRTGSCTIFNPDAYCELCNKEFCNKYFLKTHKANKHGIFTSSPGQQQQQQLQQQQQQAPQQPLQPQQPSPGGGDAYQHGLLPPQHRPLSPGSDKLSPRLPKDLAGAKHAKNLFQRKIKVKQFGANGDEVSVTPVVKCEDEYYDADVLLSRLSPLQDDKQGPAEDGGEGGNDSNESTGILRKEMQQEVPEKPVFTPEKMRSLGVINPEAFCEICCKEYCNKYFLRTHKWKRHGIAPPEGEDKESSSASSRAAAPSWLQQLQQHAAPLNLIMEEATSSGDALCKYCGQWFPSEQVLQVHVAFAHLPVKKEKADGEDGRKAEDADKPRDQIESIMDDMKKVQSMLFQLNSLQGQQGDAALNPAAADDPPSRESPSAALPCTMCKKSFPDKAALQQHVQDHHWGVAVKTERDADATPGRAAEAAAEQPLQQQQQQPAPATPQAVPEPKPVTSTPTSSYCEICNKELCNKYFMKTHMQRMHGIEIENGSQIGGVVCDICNKELCSKYFLRVHKQNTHGIVDESSGPPSQVRGGGGGGGGGGGSGAGDAMFGAHFLDGATQALKPTDLSEMSHRYFTHFNEVCTICNRRFRSVKWLKAHLMNDHGRSEYEAAAETNERLAKLPPPPGPGHGPGHGHGLHPNDLGVQLGLPMPPRERKEGKSRHGRDGGAHAGKNGNHFMANLMQGSKEYRCSYCPFSTPVLAFLYVHEKTHAGMAYLPDQKRDLQCPICFKTCTKPDQFQRHILSHQFAGLPGPGAAMFAGLDPRAAAMFHQPAKRDKLPPPPPQQQQQQQPPPPPQRATPERQPDDGDLLDGFRKCAKCGGEATSSGCANCGYAGKDMSSLQSLLKDSVTSDVKKRLEDAAKLNDIPASYAVPKTQDLDPFIMQPFIIEEPRGDAGEHVSPALDKKFVPSLVFLPVKERLSRPLTASFTLTPA